MKSNTLYTLFVGIDVSSKTNVLCAIDFYSNKLFKTFSDNNLLRANEILECIVKCLKENNLSNVIIALESTSVYSIHIVYFLSSHELLIFFNPKVYYLNPKTISKH